MRTKISIIYNITTQLFFSYSLLCEAVDQIVTTADHLRQVMGLPSRDIGVQDEGSNAELEQPPSQPCSPGIIY